jgi:hypothetical protein
MRSLVVALLLVVGPAAARADQTAKSWFQRILLNGFASASYTWNFNDPQSNLNRLRAFDTDHNSIHIDAVELVVQKPVADRGDFGFRVDVAFGAVARVAAARGLFRDPETGVAGDVDLQQAFVSYVVPLGRGLRIDAGKFVTPVGSESIDGYDGYNDNFSRSLLFTLAIPFTHTGLKLGYAFCDQLAAMVMLVNGWDNVLDNNAAKSFGVSLTITPVGPLAIYLNYIGGPERDHDDRDFRHLVDVGVVYKPSARWSLTLNGDYGLDAGAVAGANAQWAGVAAYVRWQAVKRLALIGRGELFFDLDGFRTGTRQRLLEATGTVEVRLTESLVVRGELRVDQSDRAVFERSDGLGRHYQPTVAINALYVF